MRKVSGETIDNLPALNSGKRTQLALALRGLRGIEYVILTMGNL